MNGIHNFICSSRWWERRAQEELVPWGVRDVELGEDVLEIARVLRDGGVFAGTDSIGTGLLFKLIHVGDTLLTLDPGELPGRLEAVGLVEPLVERSNGSFRWAARKAG